MEAKIVLNDEVMAHISGLDLATRKKLHEKFKFEIPGAKYQPSVRLGRWDGKKSFFGLSGSTYINLLPEVLAALDELHYDITLEDNRAPKPQFVFPEIKEDMFADVMWPKSHVRAGEPVMFRDYQIELLRNYVDNLQSIQEVATGAGKTLMTAGLSKLIEPYGRSVVIVPNVSLVTQTEEDYVNLGLDVGVYYGGRKETGHKHTICTWQSLNVLMKNSTDRSSDDGVHISDIVEDVVCVIVDECFDGNSKVLTTSGYVPIKDIKPGDKVINYSESSNAFKEDVVVRQHKNLTKSASEKMYELEFDTGVKIQVTGNHEFLTNTGWVRADHLTEEHEIVNKT